MATHWPALRRRVVNIKMEGERKTEYKGGWGEIKQKDEEESSNVRPTKVNIVCNKSRHGQEAEA